MQRVGTLAGPVRFCPFLIQVVSTVSNSISSAPSVSLAAIAAHCERFMQTGML